MIRVHMGRHPKTRHQVMRHSQPKKVHYPHHAQASAGEQARRNQGMSDRLHMGALAKRHS